MKFWVGVTDNRWFDFLSASQPDEVNFWRPRSTHAFRAIEPGAPFLFKLHSPQNYIAGGGFFVSQTVLPLSLVWETFREKNGAKDLAGFQGAIRKYRERTGSHEHDPAFGCIILASPFFFQEDQWIAIPPNWSPNLVQGKAYDTKDPIGESLWQQVLERLASIQGRVGVDLAEVGISVGEQRFGAEYLRRARLGQGAFRVLVTDAYHRKCAVSGERTLPVLQAAHIKPFATDGPNSVNNGLLLRSDLHILFDRGLMTITEDLRVKISRRIREEYENGRDYYALQGQKLIVLPDRDLDRPSRDLIRWHNERVYVS